MVSLKTKYVKLKKFLCANSQGIQIIGKSTSKISISNLKCSNIPAAFFISAFWVEVDNLARVSKKLQTIESTL